MKPDIDICLKCPYFATTNSEEFGRRFYCTVYKEKEDGENEYDMDYENPLLLVTEKGKNTIYHDLDWIPVNCMFRLEQVVNSNDNSGQPTRLPKM